MSDNTDYIEVRVRGVSAPNLDAIRPLARKYGYRQSISDLVRFAVNYAASVRCVPDDGDIRFHEMLRNMRAS